MQRAGSLFLVLFLALAGCGRQAPDGETTASPAVAAPSASAIPARPADESLPLVVFLGDSLSAGYGLDADQAFPALVEEALAERGRPIRMVNAGVSGDTTAGGLARIDWLLRQMPDLVVVELGANDGLRGFPLAETESNLRQIVERSQGIGAQVLLIGMRLPPNYGPEYVQGFRKIFPRLADELDVPLMPFLLEDVAARPELNLADGIHPNAAGHRRVAESVLPYVVDALDSL